MSLFNTTFSVTHLSASRGGFVLFENVSFRLDKGQALRITGPNGAGKTTLLRCLAGLVGPDAGSITLGGIGVQNDSTFHYLGHLNAMKPQLSVGENLAFWAKTHGGIEPACAIKTLNLVRLVDLPFSVLSSGQKRRVAFARLLLSPRAVWLLDEPTVGLDTDSGAVFETVMERHLADGGMIVATTHTPLGGTSWQTLALQPVVQP